MMLDKNGNEYYQMPFETFDTIRASLKYVFGGAVVILVAYSYPVTVIPIVLAGLAGLLWSLNH